MQSSFLLLAATAVYGEDVPTCACLAQDLEFTIDCTATAVIDKAYDYCAANCLTKCDSAECTKNFAIVEAHHDFCLHDQVPKEVEVGFHDLEEVCAKQCSIGRLKDDDHVACPEMACPGEDGMVGVVNTLYSLDCATKCTNDNACGEAFRKLRVIHDNCEAANAKAFEWAGAFAIEDAASTWLMQKVDGDYADPAMKLALIPTTKPTYEEMKKNENKGSNLLVGDCEVVKDGASMKPATAGSCFQLTVGSGADSTFSLDLAGITGLLVYAEHVPLEFERDKHFFYDSADEDIEPTAWEGPLAFEWVGVFPISTTSVKWSMQKVDGAYADPSMNIVIMPTSTPTYATMQGMMNYIASDMLTGDCDVVEDKGSMKPAAGGSCFQLTVGSGADSEFTIDTTGIKGMVVFAQHGPTEFERDKHYLYTAAGEDIEPIAQESGSGGGHDHGHRRLDSIYANRRLLDIDAALHDFEDSCDAVACYIEVANCAAGSADLSSLSTLADRASRKCHVTEEEATCCPGKVCDGDKEDQSGAKPAGALAGVMLGLMATMQ
jgi:hypothetical protein